MKVSTFKHLFRPLRPRERYMIARIQLMASARVLGWPTREKLMQLYHLRRAAWRQLRAGGNPVAWEVAWVEQTRRLLKRLSPDEAIAYVIFQHQGVRLR